jgi:hypothetical protein
MDRRDSCIPLSVSICKSNINIEGTTFFTESDNICLYGWWIDASETHTLMELDWIYLRGRGGIRRVPE